MKNIESKSFTATRNACKLCTPLGAALAFEGIENSVPLLHGSQGCSTYIRRYMISHFKEPVDIASTNFSEETAIFGGGANLKQALNNIRSQYNPELIGVATTCLSETIGDDVSMFLRSYRKENKDNKIPEIVHVSTPSYSGNHTDGFHQAVKATVESLQPRPTCGDDRRNSDGSRNGSLNLFPGMVSPEDLRYLKEIFSLFNLPVTILPDYSERLDGNPWSEFEAIQAGGTRLEDIKKMSLAKASIEFGRILAFQESAGRLLKDQFGVPLSGLGLPIGVNESDRFFSVLEEVSERKTPEILIKERGRLIDAYVDGHKYVSQIKAVVYGDPDLVLGLVSFLKEIGIIPILCATGGQNDIFKEMLKEIDPWQDDSLMVIGGDADFMEIEEAARCLSPDIVIGNSKGYSFARKLNLPLVRVGFPIHDRFGGSRILHLGYRGAQQLFDRIVNSLISRKQESSSIGYSYV